MLDVNRRGLTPFTFLTRRLDRVQGSHGQRRIHFASAMTLLGYSDGDDHLRNHGFLLTNHGWRLSPAYDLNPTPDGSGLSLNISETDNALSFDLALEVAPHFRLKPHAAETIIQEIRSTVRTWRDHAHHLAIPRNEQETMAPAFAL